MNRYSITSTLLIVCVTGLVFGVGGSTAAMELVRTRTFTSAEGQKLPPNWLVWKPEWKKAACRVQGAVGGLLVDAPTDPYAVGGVVQEIKNVQGGQAYAIEASCRLTNITAAYRSVLVRVSWIRGGKLLHPAGMFVRGPILDGEEARFDDVLVAPTDADGARLSLEVKWPGAGSVLWKSVSMRQESPPDPRKVKVGTVYLQPKGSTPRKNLRLFCDQVDAAGELGLDIVCLGEAITLIGTSASLEDCAETIPGAATEQLGKAARRNGIWVVAGLVERGGDVVYNTAVLLDRKGRIAGRYRKVHLPREEWTKGIRPGDTYPVFTTDFGRIAIQICYDWFFPEPEAIFALQGAEIIFAPTWGNTWPDKDGRVNGESVFRVRARDNGVYMVPSVYSGNSLIIDPMGKILACSGGKDGVFWAEIDLNKREVLPYVGYWRSIGPRHRMAHTYAPLLETTAKPTD